MRLIDANRLLDNVVHIGHEHFVTEEFIKASPTVEAESVRHGKWNRHNFLRRSRYGEVEDIRFTCNRCGHMFDRVYNYCGNCGAKMDERGNGRR